MKRLALAVVFLASTAHADPSKQATAQVLFEKARELMTAGKYGEACAKFAESQALDPGAGTLLNLGDCYEKDGRLASAWATYNEAISAASVSGRSTWSEKARERATALKPKLTMLTIVLAEGTTMGDLTLTRDGVKVGASELGLAVPADPGPHVVEARAPGHTPWRKDINVEKAPGTEIRVTVPSLAPVAAIAPTPPIIVSEQRKPSGTRRTLGIVGIGAGVAGLAAGSVFGLLARGKRDDALATCSSDGQLCTRAGIDDMSTARTFATVSTVGFIAGAVFAAAGLGLFFTSE